MYNTIPKMPKVAGVLLLIQNSLEPLEVGPIKTKTKETFSAENNRLGIPDVAYKLERCEKSNKANLIAKEF